MRKSASKSHGRHNHHDRINSGNRLARRDVYHRRLRCELLEDRRLLSSITQLEFHTSQSASNPTAYWANVGDTVYIKAYGDPGTYTVDIWEDDGSGDDHITSRSISIGSGSTYGFSSSWAVLDYPGQDAPWNVFYAYWDGPLLNNVTGNNLRVKPDLQVTDIRMNDTSLPINGLSPAQNVHMDFLIKNFGPGDTDRAVGNVYAKWYWGTTQNSTTNYIDWGELGSINGLQPGESEWETDGSWTLPSDGGKYWVTCVVDPDNYFPEVNNNNTLSGSFIVYSPEITVTGGRPAIEILDGDSIPSTSDGTDFGSVIQGTTAVQKSFTVKNAGYGDLTLGKLAGSLPAGFSLVGSDLPASLSSNSSATFTLRLDTAVAGTKTGTITIQNNDYNEAPFDFVIKGIVTADTTSPQASLGSTPDITIGGGSTYDFTVTYTDNVAVDAQSLSTGDVQVVGPKSFQQYPAIVSPPTIDGTPLTATYRVSAPGGTWGPEDNGTYTIFKVGTSSAKEILDVNDNYLVGGAFTQQFHVSIQQLVPEIDVLGKGVSIVDGDTMPSTSNDTEFGNVDVNGGSVEHAFTITNSGTAALNLTGSPKVSLSDTTNFSVTLQPSSPVSSGGGTATFKVKFDPASTGLKTCTVTIVNDDANESTYDFVIQGTGTLVQTPEIDVSGNSVSIADGDTAPRATDDTDFGSWDVTSGAHEHAFTITNSGTAALNLTGSPKVSLSDTTNFSVTLQPSSPVSSGGGTATFKVKFDPASTGLKTCTVTIVNDDANESTYDFVIQGTGTLVQTPEIDVSGNSVSIADGDTAPRATDDTDFGSWDVTSGAHEHAFTITNSGTAALNLTGSPKVSLSDTTNFSVTLQPSSPVSSGGGTATFKVKFDPASTGLKTCTVTIVNDDANESTYDFVIQGTGTVAQNQEMEGFETGNFSALPWEHAATDGGENYWTIVQDEKHGGTYSARSGPIDEWAASRISVTLTTEAGNISFWRKVSSEPTNDQLRFEIDGKEQDRWSGNVPWEQVTYSVTAAEHIFSWVYTKEGGDTQGSDAAWLDDITFPSIADTTPPTASTSTPSSPQNGDVTVAYILTDAESDTCSVLVEYSSDGGTTWKTATAGAGGSGTTGLTSSPNGTSHTFVWASGSDIVNANSSNVMIRITPTDTATGTAGTTNAFTVNNYVNMRPSVGVATPPGMQSGNITINYVLTDANSDLCSIQVQYSPDGGTTWKTATAGTGGDGRTGLSSSPGGTQHTFVWASRSDIVNTNNANVKIRITPSDTAVGAVDTTNAFMVNNSAISNVMATATTSDKKTVVTWNAADSNGITSVKLTIDGKNVSVSRTSGNKYSASYTSRKTLTAGSHAYVITVINSKRVQSTYSGTFRVTATTPTVSNIKVTATTSDKKTTIAWKAADVDGIVSTALTIDGKTTFSKASSGRTSAYYSSSSIVTAGAHQYVITVTDSAGKQTTTSGKFTVKATVPTISRRSVKVGTSATATVMTWNATDIDGIGSVTLTIDSIARSVVQTSGTPYAGSYSASNILSAGKHVYEITITDAFGVAKRSSGNFSVPLAKSLATAVFSGWSGIAKTDWLADYSSDIVESRYRNRDVDAVFAGYY